ncbi:MAG: alpha/beta fold hydrolase [Microthrixaceae bacterium]
MGKRNHLLRTAITVTAALVLVTGSACSGDGESSTGDSPATGTDTERTTIDLGDGDLVSYLESLPADDATGDPTLAGGEPVDVPVVFLHGGAYDAAVWSELGLLDEVAATGHRAVAIDLPGKGESVGERDADWLAEALDALGIEAAVVVSPSASGPVALGLLAEDPERFAGFVPVAPVGGGDFAWSGGEAPETVVVLGENDSGFAESSGDLASEIPGAELVVIEQAGHAAYEDRPAAFMEAVQPLL